MGNQELLKSLLGLRKDDSVPSILHQVKEEFIQRHMRVETPIQTQAIEPIYKRKDSVLLSDTASGKTEAAIIPVAAYLISCQKKASAIYLAPTRALLNDIYIRMYPSLTKLGLKVRIRHGDRPLSKKVSKLDMLFTTPESLDVLLVQEMDFLKQVSIVILDEIHQLFGTTRGSQTQLLLQRIEKFAEQQVQRITLSATIGNPLKLAEWICPGRERASVFISDQKRELQIEIFSSSGEDDLVDLLKTEISNKILIFVNSRKTADDLFLNLNNLVPYKCYIHYSSLSRSQRDYTEKGFKEIDRGICVATNTLELGIDIGSIDKVILFNLPYSVSSFLQKIGRGSRRKRENYALVIASSELEIIQTLALSNLAERGNIEKTICGKPFSVLAQQILSYVCSKKNHRIHENEICGLFNSIEWIQNNHIQYLLNALVSKNYLIYDNQWNNYQMGLNLSELFNKGKIYSNIVNPSGGFRIYSRGNQLATLALSGSRVRLGATILYSGRYWRINSISDNEIRVERGKEVVDPIRPIWSSVGKFILSQTLAVGMQEVLVSLPELLKKYNLDLLSHDRIISLSQSIPEDSDQNSILYESYSGHHIYYIFRGTIVNLALLYQFQKAGYDCKLPKKGDGIAITSSVPLDFKALLKEPKQIETFLWEHWRLFSKIAQLGPFYNILPVPLKKEEVMSQIATEVVFQELTRLSERPMIQCHLGLLN